MGKLNFKRYSKLGRPGKERVELVKDLVSSNLRYIWNRFYCI